MTRDAIIVPDAFPGSTSTGAETRARYGNRWATRTQEQLEPMPKVLETSTIRMIDRVQISEGGFAHHSPKGATRATSNGAGIDEKTSVEESDP